jgi:hypothetical protein
MAAREADCSQLPDIGLFRYFVLAHTQRASDDWTGASVTWICGQLKVLFLHCGYSEILPRLKNEVFQMD